MKRFAAVLLSAVLTFCALPLTASAYEGDESEGTPVQVFDESDETEPADDEPAQEEEPLPDQDNSEGEDSETGTALQPLFGMYIEEHVSYVSGTEDTVNPDGNLRRSEAASLIYQLLTDPADPGEGKFEDVPSGAWYQVFVDSLTNMSILSGMGDNTFAPNRNITRAEFSAILSKLFPMKTTDITFTDVPSTHWAYSYIQNLAAQG